MPRCAPEFRSRLRRILSASTSRTARTSGLLTSTNFSLIDRIRAGEEIALSEFTAGEDEITRQVIEYGGLFPFNVARMQGKVFLPPIKTRARAMTLAEKIFAAHMMSPASETPELRSAGQTSASVPTRLCHVSAGRYWVHFRRSALSVMSTSRRWLRFSTSKMSARMFR